MLCSSRKKTPIFHQTPTKLSLSDSSSWILSPSSSCVASPFSQDSGRFAWLTAREFRSIGGGKGAGKWHLIRWHWSFTSFQDTIPPKLWDTLGVSDVSQSYLIFDSEKWKIRRDHHEKWTDYCWTASCPHLDTSSQLRRSTLAICCEIANGLKLNMTSVWLMAWWFTTTIPSKPTVRPSKKKLAGLPKKKMKLVSQSPIFQGCRSLVLGSVPGPQVIQGDQTSSPNVGGHDSNLWLKGSLFHLPKKGTSRIARYKEAKFF